MTDETKERIISVLKLLFFPNTGLHHICKECKGLDKYDFHTEWFGYLIPLIIWAGVVGVLWFVVYGLIYHFDAIIIPVSVISGGVFIFFFLPTILHKILNRK